MTTNLKAFLLKHGRHWTSQLLIKSGLQPQCYDFTARLAPETGNVSLQDNYHEQLANLAWKNYDHIGDKSIRLSKGAPRGEKKSLLIQLFHSSVNQNPTIVKKKQGTICSIGIIL